MNTYVYTRTRPNSPDEHYVITADDAKAAAVKLCRYNGDSPHNMDIAQIASGMELMHATNGVILLPQFRNEPGCI